MGTFITNPYRFAVAGGTDAFNALSGWSSSKILSRTPASSGSQRVFTMSMWVKRSSTGFLQYIWAGDPSGFSTIILPFFSAGNVISIYLSGAGTLWSSSETFASTSVWYHIVFAVDTTQATASERIKCYSNGVQLTNATGNQYAQNADIKINTSSYQLSIGNYGSNPLAAKVAHITFVDGAQLTPSDFSQSGGLGKVPKAYTGSFGTNGWLMDFANSSDIGNDVSGNGLDLSVGSFVSGDVTAETVSHA